MKLKYQQNLKKLLDDIFWETTTKGIMDALNEKNIEYGIDEGGGAFYGPKSILKFLMLLEENGNVEQFKLI